MGTGDFYLLIGPYAAAFGIFKAFDVIARSMGAKWHF